MPTLHPEWVDLVTRNPNISHDADERNARFLSNPANSKLVSQVSSRNTTVPSRDNHPIPIRLYAAKETQASQGVVVFFHSGGFVGGSLETEDISCRYMALGGPLTVISVEYRLSPEYLFPIPINDGWDAFKHIVSHLPDLVPDASRPVNLVICGSSSGGQLAALVSQRAREWLVEPENATVSQKVNLVGVLLRAPVTVRGVAPESIPPRFQDAHSSWCAELETVRLDRAGMKEIHDTLAVPEALINTAEAYPLWGTLENLPRTYIQLCEADILRDDGVCYAQGLREAGVEVRETLYKDLPHIFWVYGQELQVSKQAQADAVRGLQWLMGTEA